MKYLPNEIPGISLGTIFATRFQARDVCIMELYSQGFLRVFANIRNYFKPDSLKHLQPVLKRATFALWSCILSGVARDHTGSHVVSHGIYLGVAWDRMGSHVGSHGISSGVARKHHPWFPIKQTPYRLPDWLL